MRGRQEDSDVMVQSVAEPAVIIDHKRVSATSLGRKLYVQISRLCQLFAASTNLYEGTS